MTTNYDKVVDSFEDMDLNPDLLVRACLRTATLEGWPSAEAG